MGYTVPVSFAVGDVMSASQINTCLSDAIAWLNGGIVTGDVAGIRGDRLYGVDHSGFPLQGGRGTVRESAGASRIQEPAWSLYNRIARQDIFVQQVQDGGLVPVPGLCGSRFVPAGTVLQVTASWFAAETHNWVASPIVYPKDAGEFVFRYRDRGDTSPSWTSVSEATCKLVSDPEGSTPTPNSAFHALAWFQNSKGGGSVYDFGFFYSRANANSGVKQVSVSRPQMAFTLTRV